LCRLAVPGSSRCRVGPIPQPRWSAAD
jgi:hypothetical protein